MRNTTKPNNVRHGREKNEEWNSLGKEDGDEHRKKKRNKKK